MAKFTIDVYSHGVTVRVAYPNEREVVLRYCQDLAIFDTVWVPALKKKVRKTKAVFATANSNRTEFGFLREELPKLMAHFKRHGYTDKDFAFQHHTPSTGTPIEISLQDGVGPRDDEQRTILGFMTAGDRRDRVLNLRTGGGKAQPLSAFIKVPGGWKTMGDMTVGTEVTAWDGTTCKVTGVHPQGVRPVFRLTFSDGRQVEADIDHLWSVRGVNGDSTWKTVTTEWLIGQLGEGQLSLEVPLIRAEVGSDIELSIDPFKMGMELTTALDSDGDLSIFEASKYQRYAVIQGMMEIGGRALPSGAHRLTVASKSVADLAVDLVRSVGGVAEATSGGGRHVVYIRHPAPQHLYHSPIKRNRAVRLSVPVHLTVARIDYVGMEETQCISISHPDRLYVTDGFTVTHNTICGLMTVAHFKVRTVFVMASGHFDTWFKTIKWALDVDPKKDVCFVKGRKHLINLVKLSLAGQNEYKLIFISIATLREFNKDYNADGYNIDGVTPHMLYPTIGAGIRIVDESHENIHALVTATIFTHVRMAIYLSATLVSDDAKINEQYAKIFPMEDRFKDGRENDHAQGIAIHYSLQDPENAKYSGTKGYSHVTFEQWVMGDKERESKWYDFITGIVHGSYVSDYEPTQKALIFCATTEMCERLADFIRNRYDGRFTVARYTAADDISVLHENDIVVSTPGSAGTGKDIRNLKNAYSTIAIGSVQRNLQMFGRLRPLADYPEVVPVYFWFTCRDIQSHMVYDRNKRESFAGKCKSISTMETNFNL